MSCDGHVASTIVTLIFVPVFEVGSKTMGAGEGFRLQVQVKHLIDDGATYVRLDGPVADVSIEHMRESHW